MKKHYDTTDIDIYQENNHISPEIIIFVCQQNLFTHENEYS